MVRPATIDTPYAFVLRKVDTVWLRWRTWEPGEEGQRCLSLGLPEINFGKRYIFDETVIRLNDRIINVSLKLRRGFIKSKLAKEFPEGFVTVVIYVVPKGRRSQFVAWLEVGRQKSRFVFAYR